MTVATHPGGPSSCLRFRTPSFVAEHGPHVPVSVTTPDYSRRGMARVYELGVQSMGRIPT